MSKKSNAQSDLSTIFPDTHLQSYLVFKKIALNLPPLPPVIRYYDDFDNKTRSINNPSKINVFEFNYNGSKTLVNFSRYGEWLGTIMKQLIVFLFGRNLLPQSVYNSSVAIVNIDANDLSSLLSAGPTRIKFPWEQITSKYFSSSSGFFMTIKYLLMLLCEYTLYGWSREYHQFIAEALPYPTAAKHRTVRSGEAFLTAAEESAIVNYLDNKVASLAECSLLIKNNELQNDCMLLCSYQFGMRPLQIAMVTLRDVRIWQDSDEGLPSIHLTFRKVKQLRSSACIPMTRRVKREWVLMLEELISRSKAIGLPGESRLFQVSSSHEAATRISMLASAVTGSPTTAMDLRHTAAQRLVDAGASQEEVAEFLGHSDINTCLAYFQSSASQAERINKALGISSIYLTVAKIAHDRFISREELSLLKGDQQIAGVPHGIPIAGIGGCSSGQPNCPFNPITSCYGCRKFMPINDLAIHQQVLEDMRNVVKLFYNFSQGEEHSPTYLQLKRTITCVQAVIAEIEGDNSQ
ncbi:site-specific integrase [Geobacter sp. SVR]|uniref:site-specific integrase n=1 Tax=Geobacter sp. SVR TaxID=2495594 RepID=UPI00143EF63A|nr:site-specific integrase [Geobacter sp. SVR]BCS53904.1 hypothetical protein GSVR_22120 [Geobacter sp. SVR]GCF86318.1 hypothetical protein GSbR_29180 [Geobacter sp. SVR]